MNKHKRVSAPLQKYNIISSLAFLLCSSPFPPFLFHNMVLLSSPPFPIISSLFFSLSSAPFLGWLVGCFQNNGALLLRFDFFSVILVPLMGPPKCAPWLQNPGGSIKRMQSNPPMQSNLSCSTNHTPTNTQKKEHALFERFSQCLRENLDLRKHSLES